MKCLAWLFITVYHMDQLSPQQDENDVKNTLWQKQDEFKADFKSVQAIVELAVSYIAFQPAEDIFVDVERQFVAFYKNMQGRTSSKNTEKLTLERLSNFCKTSSKKKN